MMTAKGGDDAKLMPNSKCQNVPKTIGESKTFEGGVTAKSGIVKIRLENVAFLAAGNRLVRGSIGFVDPPERCKIE